MALNEAPQGWMVQVCVAKQTPPRELLGFAGRCREDKKATPSKRLGIPYAHHWGRHGFTNEWYGGLCEQDRKISLQVGLLGIFPPLEMLQYFFGELRHHTSHFNTWGITNSCSNALGCGIKNTIASGKLRRLLTYSPRVIQTC